MFAWGCEASRAEAALGAYAADLRTASCPNSFALCCDAFTENMMRLVRLAKSANTRRRTTRTTLKAYNITAKEQKAEGFFDGL